MEITKSSLIRLIEEALGSSLVAQEDAEYKYFYLNKQEIVALDKIMRGITSEVIKTVPTVTGHTFFSIKPLLEKIPIERGEKGEERLAAEAVEDAEEDEYEKRFKSKRGTKKTEFSPEEEEEYRRLRKQYYGPEGEVGRVGIGKVRKDLPKGIGELEPEEFEEYGYVLKIPKEILDDFDVMVKELKSTGELFNEAHDWYHSINRLARAETANDRDAALFGLLIATFSPRAKFSLNLAEAAFMLKAVVHDASTNPDALKQFIQTFKPEDPEVSKETGEVEKTRHIGYLKVANFALNLVDPELAGKRNPKTGELEYNEIFRWNSTIDTWMIDAFYPTLRKASTAQEYKAIKGKMMSDPMSYTYLSELVGRKAKQLGLLPHELQAIIWVAMKRRQSGEDAATTNESIDQIKEAINNIYGIRTDMGDVKQELEESNWVHFLFKQIDDEGIEKAAEVLLGGYIEQDGQLYKIPGIRSISARGKSGDAFKYFPEEPKPPKPGKEKPKKKSASAKAKTSSPTKKTSKPKKKKPEPVWKKMGWQKVSAKDEPREKEPRPYNDPQFKDLLTHYVLNTVIQMPTGKLSNLYNAINLYLEEGFSTVKAVETILSDFHRHSKSTKDFLQEMVKNAVERYFSLQ